MKVVYSHRYTLDIGDHVFPTRKYPLVHDVLLESGIIHPAEVVEPETASWEELSLVHTPTYLGKIRNGELSPMDIARLEIPASEAIAEGFRLMSGGTVLASRLALDGRVAAHIGGGFHHAFAGHGEGFCLFNDVAVAIRVLQREGRVKRAAVVDCDVHHGNGTAMIFAEDPAVFTFSMHQENNYPAEKPPSRLDIGLADGTRDEEYLALLADALPRVMEHGPDLIWYLAGADPFLEDQLGGLALSRTGLRRRDQLVLAAARQAGRPVVVVLAGGYARRVQDTVAIHVATLAEAATIDR
jgi:acetoin utilization deacetylase AcuC-like enzyme